MPKIINTTPHDVTVLSAEGETIVNYPPSRHLARVRVVGKPAGEVAGIPLMSKTPGEVVGLPDPAEGTYYIVSGLVQAVLPNRKDLLAPDELVRDTEGRVIGCRSFSINATDAPVLFGTNVMWTEAFMKKDEEIARLVEALGIMTDHANEMAANCGGPIFGEALAVALWMKAKYGRYITNPVYKWDGEGVGVIRRETTTPTEYDIEAAKQYPRWQA